MSKPSKNRARSAGHSSSRAFQTPAVWAAAQHRFKTDAALPPALGGETRATRSAIEGSASHPPRGLSRVVRRLIAIQEENTDE